ncbi:hypothetical protein IT774_09555 [Salinimonas marina]|uniref:Uncharacterized protein n=1 Tax=Salinimonas marina TaxID=2785918 RepID=A0A7S9HC49_9ALTE|nr:hypothetical protein [Salinimonas marina]QPG04492.1 hypothetical protein IT774_09555 [Salinimonas marina]
MFLAILAGAYFATERAYAAHRVDDYQREILISSRLLRQYVHACDRQQYDNFMPFVAHSVTAYQRNVEKLPGAPFFFENEFVEQHYYFADKYESDLKSVKARIELCN